jgi:hypothetical protein
MSRFSLINVSSEKDGSVSGYWMQDHIGTLESAKRVAEETEAVNGDSIDVAVVEAVNSTTPSLNFFQDLDRLN